MKDTSVENDGIIPFFIRCLFVFNLLIITKNRPLASKVWYVTKTFLFKSSSLHCASHSFKVWPPIIAGPSSDCGYITELCKIKYCPGAGCSNVG